MTQELKIKQLEYKLSQAKANLNSYRQEVAQCENIIKAYQSKYEALQARCDLLYNHFETFGCKARLIACFLEEAVEGGYKFSDHKEAVESLAEYLLFIGMEEEGIKEFVKHSGTEAEKTER